MIQTLTLGDLLRENRRTYPDQTAAVCGDVRLTYPELDERVNRLARALLEEGVGPGDRVLWLGQNCHRVLEGLLAAAKIGAMFCPANWRWTAAEMTFAIEDLDPTVVLWQQGELGETVASARDQAPTNALWLQHDAEGEGSYEAFLARGGPDDIDVEVDPSSPVLVIYTAAFGGRPNGAMLSHAGFILEDLVLAKLQDLSARDVFLNNGPLFHLGTLMTTMAVLHLGGMNVFINRFDAEDVCRIIERERCTGGFFVGQMIERIVEVNKDRRFDLKSLRTVAGPPEWNEMVTISESPWGKATGGYGQTEVTGLVTFTGLGGQEAGSHGRTLPVAQLRIVDEDDNEMDAGEVGEIVVRGPTTMVGYWNRPEENARRQRGGWHHTHDLGRREPDGSITFIGPKTHMIKSGVENIYPAEVEACIQTHPAVAEVCVIGVPDPSWQQNVKAVVVLHAGHDVTADDIIEHCRAHIASYKKPKVVEFTERLPRAASGFIDRAAVDASFGGGGYPGPSRTRG